MLTKSEKYWYDPLYRIPHSRFELNKKLKQCHFDEFANENDFLEPDIEDDLPAMGKNIPSVWFISLGKFSVPHFAVFPPELIESLINMGCPPFVCKKCGKPRERIITKSYLPTRLKTRLVTDKTDKTGTDKDPYRSLHLGDIAKYESKVIYQHGGWTKCDCGDEFLPAIVLDPFLGSGTTALVAERLGRRFILV